MKPYKNNKSNFRQNTNTVNKISINKNTVIYGTHAVREFTKLYAGYIKTVYYTEENKLDFIESGIKDLSCRKKLVSNQELKKSLGLKEFESHQGVAIETISDWTSLVTEELENIFIEAINTKKHIILLPDIQDGHNLGAICRSAFAFDNISSIILPATKSVSLSPSIAKISVGSVFNLKFGFYPNFKALKQVLENCKMPVFGIQKKDHSININEFKLPDKACVLVFGSEDTGIPKHAQFILDKSIQIPQSEKLESLNLSVATGIILYQLMLNSK